MVLTAYYIYLWKEDLGDSSSGEPMINRLWSKDKFVWIAFFKKSILCVRMHVCVCCIAIFLQDKTFYLGEKML